jgi:hypothetical protein
LKQLVQPCSTEELFWESPAASLPLKPFGSPELFEEKVLN